MYFLPGWEKIVKLQIPGCVRRVPVNQMSAAGRCHPLAVGRAFGSPRTSVALSHRPPTLAEDWHLSLRHSNR